MSFTVIGGNGFIGSAVVAHLRREGQSVVVPARGDPAVLKRPLGNVIYAAGVTADFRARPFETLRAHVSHLAEILEAGTFDSLLYLSSARIYRHAQHAREDAPIALRADDPEDFYDLTKLTGESLCQASGRANVRVARLSNVIGADFDSSNFVFDLIRSAWASGRIELRTGLDSKKDYILVEDVAALLPRIAVAGTLGCYNVASGINTSHAEIVRVITRQTNAECIVSAAAPTIVSPLIDIQRVRDEFGFAPQDVLSKIATLTNVYRKAVDA